MTVVQYQKHDFDIEQVLHGQIRHFKDLENFCMTGDIHRKNKSYIIFFFSKSYEEWSNLRIKFERIPCSMIENSYIAVKNKTHNSYSHNNLPKYNYKMKLFNSKIFFLKSLRKF